MVSKKKKDGKPKKLKAGADSDSFKPEGSELNTEETVPAAPLGETCTSIDSAKVRRRRGAVGMEKVLMKKAKGQKTDVKYNDKGTPSRDDRTTLQSYIGMVVRKTVPINILDWRDVSKEDKAMVWKDITDTFNVAPESEKDLMISAGAKWRQFKTELFTKHVLPYLGKKKKLRKPPKMYDFVGLQAWKEFVKLRSTPQWLELHEKQSGRVKNRKCHHRTSRKGYIGLEEDLRQSWPEGEVIDRAVLWKKARLLPDGKMDEEAAVVATKIWKRQGNRDSKKARHMQLGAIFLITVIDNHDADLLEMNWIGQGVITAYMAYLHEMISEREDELDLYGFIDPSRTFEAEKSKTFKSYLVKRLKDGNADRIMFMPYNTGKHWILTIIWENEIYILDSMPRPSHYTKWEKIVSDAVKMFNAETRRGNKVPAVKRLAGVPKQPGGYECGYYVMRYMRDIINDDTLGFAEKWAARIQRAYTEEELDEVRVEVGDFFSGLI